MLFNFGAVFFKEFPLLITIGQNFDKWCDVIMGDHMEAREIFAMPIHQIHSFLQTAEDTNLTVIRYAEKTNNCVIHWTNTVFLDPICSNVRKQLLGASSTRKTSLWTLPLGRGGMVILQQGK